MLKYFDAKAQQLESDEVLSQKLLFTITYTLRNIHV